MAEARRAEDEQQESLRGEPREPVVRRQPPRPTNSSGERSERQKDHRLSQGPLSSIRAAIKRTTTRSTSLSESTPRDRRRPEITILSAEPLVSNTWFPGASGGFPPPPPPAAQIWGSSIPPTIQPPPSYDEVIREKSQEQDQVLPLSSSSVSTTTIATQTDTGPESSVPTHSHAPVQRGSVATRAPKPPRPSFPFISKPDDTPSHVDDTAGAATATVDPLLFLEDSPALHTHTPTSRHTENTRPAAFHSDLLTSDSFSPLTFASGSQTDQWVQSSSVPPPHSTVALTTPSSPPPLHTRPRPHPRTKNSLRPIKREVKVQTLVRLGQTESEVTENQEVSYQEGKYLQELLDAFSSDDWGFPDHHSNDNSESESGEEEEEEEDMSTLRARIQAFEQQQQAEDHGSHGDNGALLGRGRPEPRHRVQAPSKPAPPIAPKPSLATKTSCKGVWQGGGSVAIAVNLTVDTTTAQPKSSDPSPKPSDPSPKPSDPSPKPSDPSPKPSDPSPKPSDPSPKPSDPSPKPSDPSPNPIKTTSSTPVLNPIVPIPAPRPMLPRKPPSEPQRPDRQAGQTEGTPPIPCPPPRPPVAPRTRPSGDLHSTNTRPSVAQKPTAMTSSGRASALPENRRPSLASKPSIQTLTPAPVQATPPTLAPSPLGSTPPVLTPAPVGSTPPVLPPALPPAPVGSTPPVLTPTPVRSTPPVLTPGPVGSTPPVLTPTPVGSTPPVLTPAPVGSTPPALPPAPVRSTPPALPPALPPAPVQRKTQPVSTESEPPLPPRPQGGVKMLPLRPPPIKTVPGRPPPPQAISAPSTISSNQPSPPQDVSAPSTTSANQQAVPAPSNQPHGQSAPKRGPPLPPRPKPGHPLYKNYMKQDVLVLLEKADSTHDDCLLGEESGRVQGSHMTVINPLSDQSQSPNDQHNQSDPASDDKSQLKPPSEYKSKSEPPSILPSQTREEKTQPVTAPVSGPRCVARFDYEGEEEDELTFSIGNVIALTEVIDQEWGRGQIHGRIGIFPLAFTEILEEPPSPAGLQPIVETTKETTESADIPDQWVVALHDFPGQTAEDLWFQQGALIRVTQRVDADWTRGKLDGREGLFPTNFTHTCNTAQPMTSQPVARGVAKVLFDFSGESEDELSLKAGEVVTGVVTVDEEWYLGDAGGRRGLVPKNYLKLLPGSCK
ncbi:SH3 domain-containing protein 19-like isoform X2 [Salvelinus fontinalis]|uniref:SH3 domain-containing protein 19-like isoform X2 n=1 Tax=Salvelinus fontinalis TaxID=8038 RepID=UPI002484D932|nr:SH3 domain-containing protein 19-like isoform X2 [Salvelinus fontinalis]